MELTEKERKLIEYLRNLPDFCEADFTAFRHEGKLMKIEVYPNRLKEKVLL